MPEKEQEILDLGASILKKHRENASACPLRSHVDMQKFEQLLETAEDLHVRIEAFRKQIEEMLPDKWRAFGLEIKKDRYARGTLLGQLYWFRDLLAAHYRGMEHKLRGYGFDVRVYASASGNDTAPSDPEIPERDDGSEEAA